jgi:hypothetical protein
MNLALGWTWLGWNWIQLTFLFLARSDWKDLISLMVLDTSDSFLLNSS